MWIAACDDDTRFTSQLSTVLSGVINANDYVTVHNGGMELLDAARQALSPIDVLLLDMEMPGLSGIETALELRSFSSCTTIIALTSYTKYALPCYDIRAFHYLTKPYRVDKLRSVIDEARSRILPKELMHISTRDTDAFIPYNEIFYIESINRQLFVNTRGASFKNNRPISEINHDLCGKGFYRVHKSFIVNMAHVERIDRSARKVWLTDGSILPIGNRKLMDFVSALLQYKNAVYAHY